MEKWELKRQRKQIVQKELVHLRKKRKEGCCENQDSRVVQKLKNSSKYILFAFVFDLCHYSLWEYFPEPQQLHIYDVSQSLAFLFLYYAIYKMTPKELPIIHSIASLWLWFSVGDCFTMVYTEKSISSIPFEYYCLWLNLLMLSYKFKDELYLRYEISMCWFKLVLI
jgi:hypothetical protein